MQKQAYSNYIYTITHYFIVLLSHDIPLYLSAQCHGISYIYHALTIYFGLKYKQYITCQCINKSIMKYNKQYIYYTLCIYIVLRNNPT